MHQSGFITDAKRLMLAWQRLPAVTQAPAFSFCSVASSKKNTFNSVPNHHFSSLSANGGWVHHDFVGPLQSWFGAYTWRRIMSPRPEQCLIIHVWCLFICLHFNMLVLCTLLFLDLEDMSTRIKLVEGYLSYSVPLYMPRGSAGSTHLPPKCWAITSLTARCTPCLLSGAEWHEMSSVSSFEKDY